MLGKYYRNDGVIIRMIAPCQGKMLNGRDVRLNQEENEPLPIDYDTLLLLGFDVRYEDNFATINGITYSLSYLEQFETIDRLQDKIKF